MSSLTKEAIENLSLKDIVDLVTLDNIKRIREFIDVEYDSNRRRTFIRATRGNEIYTLITYYKMREDNTGTMNYSQLNPFNGVKNILVGVNPMRQIVLRVHEDSIGDRLTRCIGFRDGSYVFVINKINDEWYRGKFIDETECGIINFIPIGQDIITVFNYGDNRYSISYNGIVRDISCDGSCMILKRRDHCSCRDNLTDNMDQALRIVSKYDRLMGWDYIE